MLFCSEQITCTSRALLLLDHQEWLCRHPFRVRNIYYISAAAAEIMEFRNVRRRIQDVSWQKTMGLVMTGVSSSRYVSKSCRWNFLVFGGSIFHTSNRKLAFQATRLCSEGGGSDLPRTFARKEMLCDLQPIPGINYTLPTITVNSMT